MNYVLVIYINGRKRVTTMERAMIAFDLGYANTIIDRNFGNLL